MVIDYNIVKVKYEYDRDFSNTHKKSMRGVYQKIRPIDQLYDLSILDEIILVYYAHENLEVIVCIHTDCPCISRMIKVSSDTMETKCCQKRYSLDFLEELLYLCRFVIVSSLKEIVI